MIDFEKDNLPGMKVLIVDDTLENIDILGHILKQAGLIVSVAPSGTIALNIIDQDKPDLILLDIMMPDISGYDVCLKLKENDDTKDIPVIFISAMTQTEDMVKGFEVGGVDYVVKPFQEMEVLARVRTQLSLRKMTREAISLSKFPSENPNPVLRVSQDFQLLHANIPAQKLLAKHKCRKGDPVPENYRRAVQEAMDSSTGTIFEVYHDNRYFLFNVIGIPEQGYFNFYGNDITANRDTAHALQNNEARIRSIIELAVDCIVTINEMGEINSVNPAAVRTFQYLESELIGSNIQTLIPESVPSMPDNQILNKSGKIHPKLVGRKHELWGQRKDGQLFPLSTTFSGIYIDNERTFTLIMRDISEKKKAEKELQDATKAAQAASRAKSEFLANTSHEIRTPLNAITGFSKILLKLLNKNEIDEKFEQYLGIIIRSGENLTEVINNVLDLSKIESGKMEIQNEPFDLQVVIKSLVAIYKQQAMDKDLELEYRFDKSLEGLIISDRIKLNQILTNLISNAIKFTEEGFIHIDAKKEDDNILFSVKDSGIGIPESQVGIIFNAFEQTDSSMTKNYGGSGLGLAITRKMTELLGGKIWFESEAGKGSEFYFHIPLEKIAPLKNQDAKESEIQFAEENKILLVEDNEENLLLVQILLQDFGLKPILARNGIEAIEKAKEFSPDLVLMDVQMPEKDGLQATIQLRKMDGIKNIPIVGLSAHALKKHEEDALKAGMDDYLTKPLDSAKLEKILIKYLKPV